MQRLQNEVSEAKDSFISQMQLEILKQNSELKYKLREEKSASAVKEKALQKLRESINGQFSAKSVRTIEILIIYLFRRPSPSSEESQFMRMTRPSKSFKTHREEHVAIFQCRSQKSCILTTLNRLQAMKCDRATSLALTECRSISGPMTILQEAAAL